MEVSRGAGRRRGFSRRRDAGAGDERSTLPFFLPAAFFSCCLPRLPPAALLFPPHSPGSPLGAAGREAAKCLLKRRQEPRCSQHGKEKKKNTSLHKEMPLFRHFLFSESSASSCCCSLRAQRRARRLSSASGPGHPVSVLCCLSVLSSSSNERCLKPRAGCWKDNISRGWCRGAQGSALPLLPIGTGAAVLRQDGPGQP